MTAPADHPCAVCDTLPAPYGYRLPGPLKLIPRREGRALYAFACAAHRAEIERRRDRAAGARGAA